MPNADIDTVPDTDTPTDQTLIAALSETRFTARPSHAQAAALRRLAVHSAQEAGRAPAAAFRSAMEVSVKTSAHDLVTFHDTETERHLIAALSATVPDSRFTGEEGGSQGDGALEWIIDPIDGTSNFAHGFAMFSVSVAAAWEDEVVAGVVHDPVNGLTFSADDDGAYLQTGDTEEELLRPEPRTDDGETHLNLVTSFPSAEMLQRHGSRALEAFGEFVTTYSTVRRLVSGALELCHAAAGWAGVVGGCRTSPWDVAAAQLILRRAGGRYLPFGTREGRSWNGEEARDRHLAPGYVGLAPGAEAPVAERRFAEFSRPS